MNLQKNRCFIYNVNFKLIIRGKTLGIRECIVDDVVYKVEKQSLLTKAFCRLQHFVKNGFPKSQPKLLIVAPMAGHYATLLRATVQDTIS